MHPQPKCKQASSFWRKKSAASARKEQRRKRRGEREKREERTNTGLGSDTSEGQNAPPTSSSATNAMPESLTTAKEQEQYDTKQNVFKHTGRSEAARTRHTLRPNEQKRNAF